MNDRNIAFGCDHAGLALKNDLMKIARELGYHTVDCGTTAGESVDYPDYAGKVVEAVKNGQGILGILACGTGIGMCIAANRHTGIRAALVHTELEARLARQHNNVNILCFGSRILGAEQAQSCLTAFLGSHFEGGRHSLRVAKLG